MYTKIVTVFKRTLFNLKKKNWNSSSRIKFAVTHGIACSALISLQKEECENASLVDKYRKTWEIFSGAKMSSTDHLVRMSGSMIWLAERFALLEHLFWTGNLIKKWLWALI